MTSQGSCRQPFGSEHDLSRICHFSPLKPSIITQPWRLSEGFIYYALQSYPEGFIKSDKKNTDLSCSQVKSSKVPGFIPLKSRKTIQAWRFSIESIYYVLNNYSENFIKSDDKWPTYFVQKSKNRRFRPYPPPKSPNPDDFQ